MTAEDKRNELAGVVSFLIGLQALGDCLLLKAGSTITVIICVAVILGSYYGIRRHLDKVAEEKEAARKRQEHREYRRRERPDPAVFTLGRVSSDCEWPMYEIEEEKMP